MLAYGADMLWLPIAATAGHVLLLALVAAPLRSSGAYTISDFAEWRLGSRAVRHIVTGCVCFIGWFYLLPQYQGAGVTLRVLTGAPPGRAGPSSSPSRSPSSCPAGCAASPLSRPSSSG